MQKDLADIEAELVERIYSLFMKVYNGNKSEFARVAQCRESTVRRIFRNEQGITINLLLRISAALNVSASDLLNGLKIKN